VSLLTPSVTAAFPSLCGPFTSDIIQKVVGEYTTQWPDSGSYMFASVYCFIALYSVDVCRFYKFICGCKLVCFSALSQKFMNFMVILNQLQDIISIGTV